jgi:hypothetical protein
MCLLVLKRNRNRKKKRKEKREASCQASFPAVFAAARFPVKSARAPLFLPAATRHRLEPSPALLSGPAGPFARAPPLPATDARGPRVILLLAHPRRRSHPRPTRLGVRAAWPRAHGSARLGAVPRSYKGRRLFPVGPLHPARSTLAPLRRRRSNPRVAPPPSTRAVAASRRRAAVPASPPLGKGAAGVPGRRVCALHHRAVLAGAPPPPLLAVGRRAPSPPLRGDPVEFASACASFWCKPQA